jgi:hypothetical protein
VLCSAAPQLTAAAKYFHFNNKQRDSLLGGVVQAAFFIVGAPAALVVSCLPPCNRLFVTTDAPSL